jgi:hypothetical protein
MKKLILIAPIFAVGCASFDAAHIEGQRQAAAQYKHYSDVAMQTQVSVQSCFKTATTEMQTAICAMLAQSSSANALAGRPDQKVLAPTTGQIIGQTVQTVAPLALGAYGAVKAVEALAAHPKTVNPVIVEQPAPIIVDPFVVPAVEIPAMQ